MTGTEGYLGCLLPSALTEQGHQVVGVDTGYFRNGWLYPGLTGAPATVFRDIRQLTEADFDGINAVVHMAELSNDPLGDLIEDATYLVNHSGSVRVAQLAKAAGVRRFVYMSSCSVYGIAEGPVDETSPVNPQTAYARCKVLVENALSAMADDDFSPTFLRNATAFGASPRMRFDIVLNNLTGLAHTTGRIAMTSDGTPWRPLVHALDIRSAITSVLAAPREAIHAEVFNVGSNGQNYQIRDIADAVQVAYPDCAISFGSDGGDNRSYRVNFDKISSQLPGFVCAWDAQRGVQQLADIFRRIDLDEATFRGRGHVRLAQLQHLMNTGQVDEQLFWTHGAGFDAVVPSQRAGESGAFARR